MISCLSNNQSINLSKLSAKSRLAFNGNKDILLINDNWSSIVSDKFCVESALGKKNNKYTIHRAIGGKEGLEKAKKYRPIFTVTAYHMPKDLRPHGEELIKSLKALGTKVIVKTGAWYCGNSGEYYKENGVHKCEDICGADKYIYEFDFNIFKDTINAIIKDKPIPRYSFQKENNYKNKENNK